jgi:hypothetical protein
MCLLWFQERTDIDLLETKLTIKIYTRNFCQTHYLLTDKKIAITTEKEYC